MKPNYKNWIPKGMLYSLIAGTAVALVLLLVFGVFGIGVSGALTIACAKRNPQGKMIGIDRWG